MAFSLQSVVAEAKAAKKRARPGEGDTAATTATGAPEPKKWMTRGEREALRLAELERLKQERIEKKNKTEAEAEMVPLRRESSGQVNGVEVDEETMAAVNEVAARISGISVSEVKKMLRQNGQPITLFGEDAEMRLERLKQFELTQHMKAHGSAGRRNQFQDIMEKEVEEELKRAALHAMEKDMTKHDLNDEEKAEEAAKAAHAEVMAKKRAKLQIDRARETFNRVEDYILHFFKRLLREWELELDARPAAEKKTTKGKVASATQKQTRQFMKPLFKQLKSQTAPADIIVGVEKIVTCCRKKDYVAANEAYLTLAIGNAAWPMGVTMVGIHERAGREKIFSAQTAHVLNDEVQRKYIQSIKRLMTFCQHKDPNVPSKNVA